MEIKEDLNKSDGLYIILLSVHGLLRQSNLELGRDPDTGGQIKYVVELADALSQRSEVSKVHLITRSVEGKNIDSSYSESESKINDKASIIRLHVGPKRYLKKENLWPYVSEFSDAVLSHIRSVGRRPDFIHGHYADAGVIGSQVSRLLGVPFIFTGHSLGRVKKKRLIDKGGEESSLNQRFKFTSRIEAEEFSLETASLVIASTSQEVEEQYQLYDHYRPEFMRVVPPGIDLSKYQKLEIGQINKSKMYEDMGRFLKDLHKPMVLAIARPDEKKNFPALIKAFGESKALRERANLVLVAGTRKDILSLSPGARKVFRQILSLIDKYDLYGSVAVPKDHQPDDIALLYALCKETRGVFVNPALNEPFGLTIIEAAASGVPVVATKDGGPAEILDNCKNGVLVDPLSSLDIAQKIEEVLFNDVKWSEYSQAGKENSIKHYSWSTHVESYIGEVTAVSDKFKTMPSLISLKSNPLASFDRMLVLNLDHVLEGSKEELESFSKIINDNDKKLCFGVSTGRSIESAIRKLENLEIPSPAIIISGAGSTIHYGKVLVEDFLWRGHIEHRWRRRKIFEAISQIPDLVPQDDLEITEFKLSYLLKEGSSLNKEELSKHLRQAGIRVNIVWSFDNKIDIIPIRASTGMAVRHLGLRWGIEPDHILVAGFSAYDIPMLKGATLGVVVGGFRNTLEPLKGLSRVYFSEKRGVSGLVDGLQYYNFMGEIRVPEEEKLLANE